VFNRRSGIDSLYTERRSPWPHGRATDLQAAVRHCEATRQESKDLATVYRQFREAIVLSRYSSYHAPQAVARASALARKRTNYRAADSMKAMLGLADPQKTLDLGHCDAVGEIRDAVRMFAESSGIVVTHGVCSPYTLDWTVRNAIAHRRCGPHVLAPHVSGNSQLPGGTGITMVTDASFPADRMVFLNPRSSLFLHEGKKSVEVQWRDDRRELVAMDRYEFVAVKRDIITGAKTSVAFDVRAPPGPPPGPPDISYSPAGSSGMRSGPSRCLGNPAVKWVCRALSQHAREHWWEWTIRAGQWVAEMTGEAVAVRASP